MWVLNCQSCCWRTEGLVFALKSDRRMTSAIYRTIRTRCLLFVARHRWPYVGLSMQVPRAKTPCGRAKKQLRGQPRGIPGVPRKWCYWAIFAPCSHRQHLSGWVTAEPRHPPRVGRAPGPLQIQNLRPLGRPITTSAPWRGGRYKSVALAVRYDALELDTGGPKRGPEGRGQKGPSEEALAPEGQSRGNEGVSPINPQITSCRRPRGADRHPETKASHSRSACVVTSRLWEEIQNAAMGPACCVLLA
jgi:hypothetical protein